MFSAKEMNSLESLFSGGALICKLLNILSGSAQYLSNVFSEI
jgi:hypothetical protein